MVIITKNLRYPPNKGTLNRKKNQQTSTFNECFQISFIKAYIVRTHLTKSPELVEATIYIYFFIENWKNQKLLL